MSSTSEEPFIAGGELASFEINYRQFHDPLFGLSHFAIRDDTRDVKISHRVRVVLFPMICDEESETYIPGSVVRLVRRENAEEPLLVGGKVEHSDLITSDKREGCPAHFRAACREIFEEVGIVNLLSMFDLAYSANSKTFWIGAVINAVGGMCLKVASSEHCGIVDQKLPIHVLPACLRGKFHILVPGLDQNRCLEMKPNLSLSFYSAKFWNKHMSGFSHAFLTGKHTPDPEFYSLTNTVEIASHDVKDSPGTVYRVSGCVSKLYTPGKDGLHSSCAKSNLGYCFMARLDQMFQEMSNTGHLPNSVIEDFVDLKKHYEKLSLGLGKMIV